MTIQSSMDMIISLKIPARINILGNPTDANEGDFATISSAVNIYAGAYIEKNQSIIIEEMEPGLHSSFPNYKILSRQEYPHGHFPLPYTNQFDLIKAGINHLYKYSDEFSSRYQEHGFKFSVWSEVPRQSGLGGSSLLVLLALSGMREIYRLNQLQHNNYVLSELAQRTEAQELNITCGYADRYVPLFGGLAYIDYRGKLLQEAINQEPYVTYERLDQLSPELHIVAACTGIKHDSGDVHGRMRPRYLQEYHNWKNTDKQIPPMLKLMSDTYETAWRGKIMLLKGDLTGFGWMMNENHRLVDEMMKYCGFHDGAGWANNMLIKTALDHGALGAKLTGAGNGGSVFALVKPTDEGKILAAWNNVIREFKLMDAWTYRIQISKHGLDITYI